ncbi:hypothetical protein WJX72_006398 [[Myrmecia] bisecta]|uniref:Phospho-N-acetylmuramoyl-pentapeptide-transferase n=1 Tax=[Myrmecia] bisecta TaxID=41462 RepID=A0AAW1Q957_9CHLO
MPVPMVLGATRSQGCQGSLAPGRPAAGLAVSLLAAAIVGDVRLGAGVGGLPLSLCFVASCGASALAGLGIERLLRRQLVGQVIRASGPASHLTKAGTPTFGGLAIVPVGLTLGSIMGWIVGPDVGLGLPVALVTLAHMCIGLCDDWLTLTRRVSRGLPALTKLTLQVVAAGLFCASLALGRRVPTGLPIAAWPGLSVQLGRAYWPAAGFVVVAESNGANLADGLDGLAAGASAAAFMSFALILRIATPSLACLAAAMAGSCIGFLALNCYPARLFMGDTGSLALGACLGGLAVTTMCLAPLALATTVFVVEAASVVLQVCHFKLTKFLHGEGKRLFKMAPLHHHFELSGHHETVIVAWVYAAALASGLCALALAVACGLPLR